MRYALWCGRIGDRAIYHVTLKEVHICNFGGLD